MSDLERIQQGDGSKFNSAIADLERIHNLLLQANVYSRTKQYDLWLTTLHTLERELCTWMNEDEIKELLDVRVTSIAPDRNYWTQAYYKLDAYERKLRYFRAKKKLGIIADEDARSAALR